MIPKIEEILMGLVKGQYTAQQAEAWIKRHTELSVASAESQKLEAEAAAFIESEHAAADQYLAAEWSHYSITDETRAIARSAWIASIERVTSGVPHVGLTA